MQSPTEDGFLCIPQRRVEYVTPQSWSQPKGGSGFSLSCTQVTGKGAPRSFEVSVGVGDLLQGLRTVNQGKASKSDGSGHEWAQRAKVETEGQDKAPSAHYSHHRLAGDSLGPVL